MIRLFKIAAWTMMGWALYRAVCKEDEEEPAAGGPRGDAGSEPAAPAAGKARSVSAAADAEPASVAPPQDLRKIRGIGPGIAAVLGARGITTWARLAQTEVADLRAILEEAGPRYRVHDPSTWPAQAAELAKAN